MDEDFDVVADAATIELLRKAQFTTFSCLREAEAKLQSINRHSEESYNSVQKTIHKKVTMLEEMAENLKHIYSQLSHIEDTLTELERDRSVSTDNTDGLE